MLRIALAVGAALLALACRGHASPDDCREITEHYIDLALRETPGASAMSSAQSAAVRDIKRDLKRAEPTYRRVQDHCEDVSRREVSCAADAKTTTAWEGCVQPDGGR
ncbi:MAG: hypothetical protein ACLP1X_00445 [Polyangiaceae bacterium]